MTAIRGRAPTVVDYDSNDYDYRDYWLDRGYERRAEHAVLRRVLRQRPTAAWTVDLGGGYGRNVDQLLARSDHVLLVDYSRTNLRNAARRFAREIASGRVVLLRADLHALPLRDRSMDAGAAVRVLHHLPDLDVCLPEMLRVIGGWALVDVPIKNHLLARWRHRHGGDDVSGPEVLVRGCTESPFSSFALDEVRRSLERAGFGSRVAASVNNFRRWDRVAPPAAVAALGPLVDALELVVQRGGRGWWGPNQFLLCQRPEPLAMGGSFADRLQCPSCRGDLDWYADRVHCPWCVDDHPFTDGYWDFTGQG